MDNKFTDDASPPRPDAIDDAVEKIREGAITRFRYGPSPASLVARQ